MTKSQINKLGEKLRTAFELNADTFRQAPELADALAGTRRNDSRYIGSDHRARRYCEVNQYLVRYRRSTVDLLQFEDLGPDRAAAMSRRIEEEKIYKDDPDIEVVLLTASSHQALIRTHAHYFKSVPELAAALAAALPAIPEA